MSAEIKSTIPHTSVTGPRLLGMPLNHPLRGLPVAALVVAGAAHIPVIPAHLREAPYIGILFIVLAAGSLVLAGVLAFRDVAAAYVLTAVVMALALVAYVISRTVGLPLIGDDVGNWLEPLGVVSIIAEIVACAAAIALSRHLPQRRGAHTSTATREQRGNQSNG
jgi:hypothetical protein